LGFVLEGSSTIAWADSAFSYGVDSARGVFDVPSAGIRLAGGLIENRPFGFQGKAKLIGLSVSRESVFRPNGNERMDIDDITLKNAATVSIEVNGIAARTLRLGPGVWHLSDLPLSSGLNDVVVRIAEDGKAIREIRLGIPFDLSIIDPGQIDYAATGGVARSSLSRPFGSAWFRAGIARALELDIDLEGMPGRYLGGLSALWASPIGFLGAGGSLSVPFDGAVPVDLSGAAKVSWRFASAANRYIPRLGLAAVYRSAGFIAPSEDGITHDPQASRALVLSGQIGQTLPSVIGSLGIFTDSILGDRGLESLSVQAGYFLAFAKSFSLSLSGGAVWTPGNEAEPRASVVLAYAPARVGAFQYRNDLTGKTDSVDATLLLNEAGSAAVGARYSNLVWMADSDRAASVFARYGAGFGDMSSSVFYNSYARTGSFAVSGNLSASTGIAFAGGTFALGAARDESYVVLAPSSAFSGTRVSLRTSEGSVTESKRGGAVSVGGLSLYRPISATVGLPASNVDKTPVPDSVVLNPGYKSVTIIRVAPASSLVVRGRAVDARGTAVIGESGIVSRLGNPVAGAPVPKETFTDETGVFECYGLEAGDYAISWSGGKVSRITVPKGSAEGSLDIGSVAALIPDAGKGGTK
jgi:outer membrane usher protein